MSFDFKGGTSKDFRTSFKDRKHYKEEAKLQDVNMLDTWYQYPNYGLLNKNYEPVILNTDENSNINHILTNIKYNSEESTESEYHNKLNGNIKNQRCEHHV